MKANIVSIGAGKAKTYGEDGNQFESAYKKDIFFNYCDVDDLGIIEDFQVDKQYHGGIDNAIHIGSTKHFNKFEELHNKKMDKLSMGCNILIDSLDESDIWRYF
jgi:MOSC domain-containing protein YiiM